ncbi:MAG: type II toxin-antitoxin system HicA family toxin [Thermoguttaceae bacterium]|nr:type II toxin-antitoxin system HicA family toxin [Thermoguttaceae bacterium]
MRHFKVREIITQLKNDGWNQVSSVGGHLQFKHPTKKGRVTVSTSHDEIFGKTLKSIESQAGIKFK